MTAARRGALLGRRLAGQGRQDRHRLGGAAPHQGGVEPQAQPLQGEGVDDVGALPAQDDGALLHAPGVRDDDQQDARGPQGHELEVAQRRQAQAGVLDDGELAGEPGQDPHGARHHLLQVGLAGQQRGDGGALGGGQRLDAGDLVDEEPVALFGGHAPGARVRLVDVALVLQDRHVVADGGRGDAQAVALD